MRLRDYILILVLAVEAVFLYIAKVDLETIAILAFLVIGFRLFRKKLYTRIEGRIRSRVVVTAAYPEWAVKLVVLISFIVTLIVLKWIVFEVLKISGLDIEQSLRAALAGS